MNMTERIGKAAGKTVRARTLIYVPIIHTQADMGALGESVRRVTIQKLGKQGWERNVDRVAKLWAEIEQAVDGWNLSYERVRLYQDGLPVCGREVEIVAELAKAGSRNHQLLLRLQERGARIMGTESSELLLEEYQLIKQLLAVRDPLKLRKVEAQQKAVSHSLLKTRDRYIADHINRTLGGGETGILFLGMLHCLDEWLDKNIQVTYPLYPPLAASEKRR
jgi:hypothetical protein